MQKLFLLMVFPLIFAGSCDPSLRCFDQYDSELDGDIALFEELRDHGSTQPFSEVMEAEASAENIRSVHMALNAASETVWQTDRIQVCWEDSSWNDEDQVKREIVRQAVVDTWEDALFVTDDKNVQFTGWERCSEGNSDGIRIQVTDSGPKVKALGNELAGMRNGMHLNFDFENWSSGSCDEDIVGVTANEDCINDIAVHEFGHALGIAHEQNRHDTELGADEAGLTCDEDQQQGSSGDLLIGPWDPDSVMNYCGAIWNNGGNLSDLDRAGIRALYFPELVDGVYCMPTQDFDAIVHEEEVATNIVRGMNQYAGNYDTAIRRYLNATQGLPVNDTDISIDDQERFSRVLQEYAIREQDELHEVDTI